MRIAHDQQRPVAAEQVPVARLGAGPEFLAIDRVRAPAGHGLGARQFT